MYDLSVDCQIYFDLTDLTEIRRWLAYRTNDIRLNRYYRNNLFNRFQLVLLGFQFGNRREFEALRRLINCRQG